MAYTGKSVALVAQGIEGTVQLFAYVTADQITAVIGAGYFSDGGERGMKAGDWIFCVAAGNPFLLSVVSVSGFAVTAASAVLNLSGNSFPTTQPVAGSGIIWNNAGILCVA